MQKVIKITFVSSLISFESLVGEFRTSSQSIEGLIIKNIARIA